MPEDQKQFTGEYFIGSKIVRAQPQVKDGKEGYQVVYPDGYISWSPKSVFEKAYLGMGTKSEPAESHILKTSVNGDTITPKMVNDFIAGHETVHMPPKTTVVKAVLKNGFIMVENSSCVAEENYDEKLGEQICLGRIKNKVWELLGFLLQTAVNGVDGKNSQDGK